MKCKQCKKEIEKYCDYPGELCLTCYEKEYEKKDHSNEGAEIVEAFRGGIINKNK